jgi:hypothetical protein
MFFSKRHKDSLRDKILKVSIDRNTRMRLFRCIQNYDFSIYESTETGFNYIVSACNDVLKHKLLDEEGWSHLIGWDGEEKRLSSISDFVEIGMPKHILDALELFSVILEGHKENIKAF